MWKAPSSLKSGINNQTTIINTISENLFNEFSDIQNEGLLYKNYPLSSSDNVHDTQRINWHSHQPYRHHPANLKVKQRRPDCTVASIGIGEYVQWSVHIGKATAATPVHSHSPAAADCYLVQDNS